MEKELLVMPAHGISCQTGLKSNLYLSLLYLHIEICRYSMYIVNLAAKLTLSNMTGIYFKKSLFYSTDRRQFKYECIKLR